MPAPAAIRSKPRSEIRNRLPHPGKLRERPGLDMANYLLLRGNGQAANWQLSIANCQLSIFWDNKIHGSEARNWLRHPPAGTLRRVGDADTRPGSRFCAGQPG